MSGGEDRLLSQAQMLVLPLIGCVTLGKSLNLSVQSVSSSANGRCSILASSLYF